MASSRAKDSFVEQVKSALDRDGADEWMYKREYVEALEEISQHVEELLKEAKEALLIELDAEEEGRRTP